MDELRVCKDEEQMLLGDVGSWKHELILTSPRSRCGPSNNKLTGMGAGSGILGPRKPKLDAQ